MSAPRLRVSGPDYPAREVGFDSSVMLYLRAVDGFPDPAALKVGETTAMRHCDRGRNVYYVERVA